MKISKKIIIESLLTISLFAFTMVVYFLGTLFLSNKLTPLPNEWIIRILMLGNVFLTSFIMYLIYNKLFKFDGFAYVFAFVVTVIVANIAKFIVNIIDGEFSIAYLLLIVIAIFFVNRE